MNASLLSWEVRYRVGYLHTQRFVPSLPSSEWLEPRRRHVDPGDVAVRELLKSYFAETINHPRWWYISSINQNEYYFPLKARTRSRSHSLSLIRFLESTASEKQPVERDKLRTGNALLRFFFRCSSMPPTRLCPLVSLECLWVAGKQLGGRSPCHEGILSLPAKMLVFCCFIRFTNRFLFSKICWWVSRWSTCLKMETSQGSPRSYCCRL